MKKVLFKWIILGIQLSKRVLKLLKAIAQGDIIPDCYIPLTVVDFHRIFSLPKPFIRNILKNINIRLRLLPPYREHLSQAFARYFMRVGLPQNISKEEVKNNKYNT